jgi:hypothetical protein
MRRKRGGASVVVHMGNTDGGAKSGNPKSCQSAPPSHFKNTSSTDFNRPTFDVVDNTMRIESRIVYSLPLTFMSVNG